MSEFQIIAIKAKLGALCIAGIAACDSEDFEKSNELMKQAIPLMEELAKLTGDSGWKDNADKGDFLTKQGDKLLGLRGSRH